MNLSRSFSSVQKLLLVTIFSLVPILAIAQDQYQPPTPYLRVIGQSCVAGGGYVDVTFQIQNVCPIWDHDLYIDGSNYGGIDSCGSPKTVRMGHNGHYGAYGYSWSMPSTPYIYFYTNYCPAPPVIDLQHDLYDAQWSSGTHHYMNWNQSIRIYWYGSNATYCDASNFSTGGATSGYVAGNIPTYNTWMTYAVTCYGPGGYSSRSFYAYRYAPPAPTVTLYQSNNYTGGWSANDSWMPWNGYLYLHWATANVDYCYLHWSGAYPGPNGIDYYPPLPAYGTGQYYTVSCYGPGGGVGDYIWVGRESLPPPPTASVSANPTSRLVGQSSLITYSSSGNVTSCTLQEQAPGGSWTTIIGSSAGASSISRTMNSQGTWNYRASCTGPGGSSSWVSTSVTVVYPNPAANLQVRRVGSTTWSDSLTIDPGEQIELGWNQTGSANTTSCAAVPPLYGFATGNAISGIDNSIDEPIGNSSYIYRLLCYGQGSPATQAADTLTVTTNGGVGAMFCPGTEVSLVSKGSSLNLCWQLGTNDPAMCSISAGSNPLLPSLSSKTGTYTYPSIVGEVTFTLSCQGGDSDTMTVKVLPELQET